MTTRLPSVSDSPFKSKHYNYLSMYEVYYTKITSAGDQHIKADVCIHNYTARHIQ